MTRALKVFKHDFQIRQNRYVSFETEEQFMQYFFPTNFRFQVVEDANEADICILNVNMTETPRNGKFNVLISLENMSHWRWYGHKNVFGEYGDKNVCLYFYNHISRIKETPEYLAIPTAYTYINYLVTHERFQPALPLAEKRCLLVINRSRLNSEVDQYTQKIEKLLGGTAEHISEHTAEVGTSSCYHSKPLLRLFNRFKFVLCIENSYNNGYITEKIFNCFLAQTIPIYLGAPDAGDFLNLASVVNLRDQKWDEKLQQLNRDSNEYTQTLNAPKIAVGFSNENYVDRISTRLGLALQPVKKIISFSLWGPHEFYNYGALENALLAKTYYPDWICRFYYHNADAKIIETLRLLPNVELVEMTGAADDFSNMFWRFAPAFRDGNTVVVCRDTDSRLNEREKQAVDAWLESPKNFHIMRDHPHHGTQILGGLWGARNGVLASLCKQFESFARSNHHGLDQQFLKTVVYPHVQQTLLVHDTHNHYAGEERVQKFNEFNSYTGFVGAYSQYAPLAFAVLGELSRKLKLPERLQQIPATSFCDYGEKEKAGNAE